MDMIVFIPALIAAYVALAYSPEKAFLLVYIPVLLLLPEYYRWMAAGLPDPTFSEAAIIPIAIVFLLRMGRRWTFTFTDLLVFGFAFCVAYAEFLSAGYSDAQNLMFDMLGKVLFPYMLAKGLIEPLGLRVTFAKRLVFILFCVAVIGVLEFRLGMTPWRLLLDPFFPGQAQSWVTNSRWGFPRVAGPYAHAILAGLMLVVGYRIHRWLEWSQQWEPRFRKVPWLGLSKAGILTLGLLGGIFMTLSRGPWLGGLLAGVVVMIGRTKNRWKTLAVASLLAVGLGLPAGFAVQEYVSVGRQGASSLTQETAAYRKEMVEKYLDIALEHSLWGWGTNGWPQIPGMPSIDNHYLLMALRYGFLSLSLFVLILATTSFRLFRMGMRQPPSNPPGSSLAFTLLSLYAVIGISITTVFLGVQTLPMLFLITGWAEGYLLLGEESVIVAPSQQASLPTFKFQRVLT
jgi:hypothetical protein